MTTINLTNNTETFTLNGIVYTHHTETGRFSKTENGKTKRIGVTEYQVAEAEADELDRKAAELDAAAENPEVSLEQFVELVQEAEESENTEKIEEIQREMAPKAKKARKSKDIAYTYYTDDEHTNALFTLTAKQVDFLHEMVDTMAWDGFDHPLYIDLLVDEIGGQFAGKPMTVGAMISTLCEKGLGERETTRRDNHKCTSFILTEMGQAVAIDLDL